MQENLTHLVASSILIVGLTALALIAVHLVGRRVSAWAGVVQGIRESRRQQLVTLTRIVEWIVAQPWSDRNVVSKGISYTATTTELFAKNNHPAVKAIIPGHGFWDPYTDVAFPGGCFYY